MLGVVSSPLRPARLRCVSLHHLKLRALIVLTSLTLFSVTSFSADTIVFGPHTYNGNGRPVLDAKRFRIADPSGTFVLRVTNRGVTDAFIALNGRIVLWPSDFRMGVETTRLGAGQDGVGRPGTGQNRRDERWEAEWERLRRDGRTARARDQGRGFVPLIEREVTLRAGNNNFVIGFWSPRGTSLTVEIVRKDPTGGDTTPPSITATASPAPNAGGWNNTPVTVIFSCADTGSGIATCPAPVVVSADGAGQRFSGTAVDVAGNSAMTSVTLSIDQTPPVVSASASPGANANGWNSGPVTVTFAASDALSGIVPGSLTAPVTLATDGVNLSASGQATDLAGNVGSAMVTGIDIDQIAPALSVALSPAPGSTGFYTGPVTAQFTCSDAGSGISSCPPNQVVSTEGLNQDVTGTVTDLAGNAAATTSAPFSIDVSGPTITVSLSPPANTNGWNNSPVTAHFECADAVSGVSQCPLDQTVGNDGVNQTVTGQATDVAGNVASVTSAPVNVDTTPPTIVVTLSPLAGPGGVFNGPVTAHFVCADLLSGVATCPPDQTVTTPGANQTVTGTTTDLAENSASVTSDPFTIVLPTPTITITLSPAPNANGWNNTPVTAHFTCTEDGVPLAGCPPDQVITTEGANQTVTGSVTNGAGQTATATSVPFSIDLGVPAIAVSLSPGPNASGWNNTPVTAQFTCADTVSGVTSCPADQTVTADGANQFLTGIATDVAGNMTTASATVSLDRAPPLFTLSSPADGTPVFVAAPRITGTATDALSGVASARLATARQRQSAEGSLTVRRRFPRGPTRYKLCSRTWLATVGCQPCLSCTGAFRPSR